MDMQKLNKIIFAVILVLSTVVYFATVAPTLSFWDCGEFIACSYRMAVPHPPGAPLFLLVGRLFTLLPIVHDIGFRVNLISVLASAITVALLYLIIVHLYREYKGKLETKTDWLVAIFSGILGSLTFAFTHSFWFNAAEAEVYASSMLFTSLIIWLILVWSTKSDKPGNERYLLIIAYLIGLAIGVHLLNVLALPFVTMIYYYKKYDFNTKSFMILVAVTAVIMLAVYPGMVKYMPYIALKFGAIGLTVFFIAIIWATWWAISNKKSAYILVFASILLITIGYSTYATIYIRSNLNPKIDENNPENVKNFMAYIEREQYGEHSITDRKDVWRTSENARKYDSTWDFFWDYQIEHMYVRYFLWQFAGMSSDETNVDFMQFLMLPLILGLIGLLWHFLRDSKRALAVLALFFMTGLAIVLYLNQPDPQPRERDYSYVGSFFAYSIWVGLGFAGLMELLKEYVFKSAEKLKPAIIYTLFAVLLVAIPGNMLAKNFHSHNRSGNYVAWDYSYNMLMSCEPNAVLFTNGDNDTFPLWYLQEVAGVRTDVRIVNLSLLNTDWYIKQLRDLEPRVPMRMSDIEIDRVGVRPWKAQKVSVEVPLRAAKAEQAEYIKQFAPKSLEIPREIKFLVKPTINVPYRGSYLRTQDWMILNIIAANRWRRPIYFAVTIPYSNLLNGLRDYMRMDGLVMKLVPYKNWRISVDKLYNNLVHVYKYRNLNNPRVYFNRMIVSLLQNYRSGFIQLAQYYMLNKKYDKVKELVDLMTKKISPQVIPWNPKLSGIKDAYLVVADPAYKDSILANDRENANLPMIGENLLRLGQPKTAADLLEKSYELNPANPRVLSLLLNAYQMSGQRAKAVDALEQWLQIHPGDRNAKRIMQSLKKDTTSKN